MSEQLLTILKFCLLALVYLFFLRVLRAVWVEVNGPPERVRRRAAAKAAAGAAAAPAAAAPEAPSKRRRKGKGAPTQLVVVEPAAQQGRSFPLGGEITLGRAAGCQVVLDDTYASQLHARVFARDGQFLVEDLGSTNGTYLNRDKVSGPMMMRRGDRLRVGNTVLELS